MKTLWGFFGRLRLFKRLRRLETLMATLHVCNRCGGVYYAPSKAVHKWRDAEGQLVVSCKWDAAQTRKEMRANSSAAASKRKGHPA